MDDTLKYNELSTKQPTLLKSYLSFLALLEGEGGEELFNIISRSLHIPSYTELPEAENYNEMIANIIFSMIAPQNHLEEVLFSKDITNVQFPTWSRNSCVCDALQVFFYYLFEIKPDEFNFTKQRRLLDFLFGFYGHDVDSVFETASLFSVLFNKFRVEKIQMQRYLEYIKKDIDNVHNGKTPENTQILRSELTELGYVKEGKEKTEDSFLDMQQIGEIMNFLVFKLSNVSFRKEILFENIFGIYYRGLFFETISTNAIDLIELKKRLEGELTKILIPPRLFCVTAFSQSNNISFKNIDNVYNNDQTNPKVSIRGKNYVYSIKGAILGSPTHFTVVFYYLFAWFFYDSIEKTLRNISFNESGFGSNTTEILNNKMKNHEIENVIMVYFLKEIKEK